MYDVKVMSTDRQLSCESSEGKYISQIICSQNYSHVLKRGTLISFNTHTLKQRIIIVIQIFTSISPSFTAPHQSGSYTNKQLVN